MTAPSTAIEVDVKLDVANCATWTAKPGLCSPTNGNVARPTLPSFVLFDAFFYRVPELILI